jgi:hypothetical protein
VDFPDRVSAEELIVIPGALGAPGMTACYL